MAFNGLTTDLADACSGVGSPVPQFVNPADHIMDLVSTDYGSATATQRDALLARVPHPAMSHSSASRQDNTNVLGLLNGLRITTILIERCLVNYSRNLLAYG